jgi:hypothetical protein
VRTAVLLCLGVAGAVFGLGLVSPFLGCSGDDSGASDGGVDTAFVPDSFEEGPNFCDLDAFNMVDGNGGACSPIAPTRACFIMCEAGGCSCVTGPKGTGIWQCTLDLSCLPPCMPENSDCGLDGGIFEDTGPLMEASFDAPLDAKADGGGHEAGTDGGAEDGS